MYKRDHLTAFILQNLILISDQIKYAVNHS
jgi:hypothetical protein